MNEHFIEKMHDDCIAEACIQSSICKYALALSIACQMNFNMTVDWRTDLGCRKNLKLWSSTIALLLLNEQLWRVVKEWSTTPVRSPAFRRAAIHWQLVVVI